MRCEYCGAAGTMAQKKCWQCGTPFISTRLRIRIAGYSAPPFPASPAARLRTLGGFFLPENSLPVSAPATDTAARPDPAVPAPSRQRIPFDLTQISDTLATATPIPAPPPARRPWRLVLGTSLLVAGAALGSTVAWWLHNAERGMEAIRPAVGALAASEPPARGIIPEQRSAESLQSAKSAKLPGEEASPTPPPSNVSLETLQSDTFTPEPPSSPQPPSAHQAQPGVATKAHKTPGGAPLPGKKSRKAETSPALAARRPSQKDRLAAQASAQAMPGRPEIARPEPEAAVSSVQSAPTPPAKPARTERQVRNLPGLCANAGNFFRREQCKWRVCDGHWGQYGCPPQARNDLAL